VHLIWCAYTLRFEPPLEYKITIEIEGVQQIADMTFKRNLNHCPASCPQQFGNIINIKISPVLRKKKVMKKGHRFDHFYRWAEDLNLQDVWSRCRDDFKSFYCPEWGLWMLTEKRLMLIKDEITSSDECCGLLQSPWSTAEL
jgi:hypothetical protein